MHLRPIRIVALVSLMLIGQSPALATERRQFNYMTNCQGCHLPDGSGNPQRQVPAFPGLLGKFLGVPGGRQYLVQVPGSSQSKLSDDELAGVLNWMLLTFSAPDLPRDFKPYTGAELHQWRQNIPSDIGRIRAVLLTRIAQRERQKH